MDSTDPSAPLECSSSVPASTSLVHNAWFPGYRSICRMACPHPIASSDPLRRTGHLQCSLDCAAGAVTCAGSACSRSSCSAPPERIFPKFCYCNRILRDSRWSPQRWACSPQRAACILASHTSRCHLLGKKGNYLYKQYIIWVLIIPMQ